MAGPDSSDEIVSEAEAQSEETLMPWLWGGCGLVLIAGFVAWVMLAAPHGHHIREPAGAAPLIRPINQHD
jgi:hypothetical protein